MTDYLEIDPATAEKRQIYRMLVGSVVPRPIGWASTLSKSGVANLAPFSFFTVVCVVPPMISLTIARNPDGSEKHTLKNIRDSGEFCFNVVTHPVWKEMVDSRQRLSGRTIRSSTKTGLTPIPCVKIKAPRVKEVPIHFECKLERVLELGPNRHPLVIGEVVYMHVDPACMTGKYIDMRKLDPIGRLNGFFYSTHRRNLRARIRRRPAALDVAIRCQFQPSEPVRFPACHSIARSGDPMTRCPTHQL